MLWVVSQKMKKLYKVFVLYPAFSFWTEWTREMQNYKFVVKRWTIFLQTKRQKLDVRSFELKLRRSQPFNRKKVKVFERFTNNKIHTSYFGAHFFLKCLVKSGVYICANKLLFSMFAWILVFYVHNHICTYQ